jgi:alkylhydroperoxidase family enzyme
VTRTPQALTAEDHRPLRENGLTDKDIHDAVQVIAYFNYITRIADALGTDLEPEMPERPEGWGGQ